MLKNFFRGILLSLMGIIIVSLLFSFGEFSAEKVQTALFDDIYERASESSKQKFFSKMDDECSSIISGEAESDVEGIEELCRRYKNKEIGGKTFFLELVSYSMNDNGLMASGELSKLERINNLLNNKALFAFAMIILLFAILILSKGIDDFVLGFGKLLFNVGLFIILSYILLKAYVYFAAVDTSPVFEMMTGTASEINIVPITSMLFPMLLLKFYNMLIVLSGAVFIIFGIGTKVIVKGSKRHAS